MDIKKLLLLKKKRVSFGESIIYQLFSVDYQALKYFIKSPNFDLLCRQRLRPWLIHQLDSGNVLGLDWIDRKNMVFKIPWKHGGKQDWDPRQAQIFKVT